MRTFLVRIEKHHTIEDFKNGVPGSKTAKHVMVKCDKESDVESVLIKDEGFEIASIEDWDALQQAQMMLNVQWILNR